MLYVFNNFFFFFCNSFLSCSLLLRVTVSHSFSLLSGIASYARTTISPVLLECELPLVFHYHSAAMNILGAHMHALL